MVLFIEFDDANVTRVVVETGAGNDRIQYNHMVYDAELEKLVLATVPQSVLDAVTWARARATEAKDKRVDEVLKSLAGVKDEDLATIKAAIEATKEPK